HSMMFRMRFSLFSIFLFSLLEMSASADGVIGFQIDLEESGSEFRHFYNTLATAFHNYSADLNQYVVPEDELIYMENAFHLPKNAETRIPRIMEKLRAVICQEISEERYFPTLGVTRYMMPGHTELSVRVDGMDMYEQLASVLRRFGLSSHPAEFDRKTSNFFSPRRVILARIPREVKWPERLDVAWKRHSDIRVKPRITILKCDSNWKESDCRPVEWADAEAPCPKGE
ncbi:hypothetical protein PENTCL1PPCAC_10150, partial [Pristionchus entomophagus]